jgi:hypothetical protein
MIMLAPPYEPGWGSISTTTWQQSAIVERNITVCLINYAPWNEDVWGRWGVDPQLLTSAVGGGEWSASCPGHFTPRKKAPGIHRTRGWVGSRTGLDAMKKRNISCPCQKSNAHYSTVQPKAQSLYRLSWVLSYKTQEIQILCDWRLWMEWSVQQLVERK